MHTKQKKSSPDSPRPKVREEILFTLQNSPTPLSAEHILKTLKRKKSTLNKTTVYRALDAMLRHAEIREVQFSERKKRFEIENTKHHHHLVCTKCESVKDIVLPYDLAEDEQKIQKQTGFKIHKHALEFFGTCANCS